MAHQQKNGSQNGTEKRWKFNGWPPKRRGGAKGATHGTREPPVAPRMEANESQNTQSEARRPPKWGFKTPDLKKFNFQDLHKSRKNPERKQMTPQTSKTNLGSQIAPKIARISQTLPPQ